VTCERHILLPPRPALRQPCLDIVDGAAGANISQMADNGRDTYPSRFRCCVSLPSVIMRTYAANKGR
jgi:hypothetical protein